MCGHRKLIGYVVGYLDCGSFRPQKVSKLKRITDQESINNSTSTVQKQQIVSFETGGDMLSVAKPAMATEESMLVSAQEDRVHGLIDFLQRPIPVGRHNWVNTDQPASIVMALNFPETIWAQPMWAEKLKGFRYLKADLCFQIQVNGSPFDVGRLWAFWSPFDSERADRRPTISRTNMTGYPGVEVDIGNQMTSELRIPYVSMYTHIDQLLGSQPYGLFRLAVISQFFSINSNSAGVTVYCWMENIDLAIPTDTVNLGATVPFVGQGKSKRNMMHQVQYIQRGSEAEVRSKKGIVTTGATIVGDVAKLLGNVPIIGEVAKPVAWVADAVKGVASFLGFSKPVSLVSNQPLYNLPAKGFTFTDGLDDSNVLGSKVTNEVAVANATFGTDIDEMNMSYIIGRPNWIEAFNWSSTRASLGAPLYKIPIHPGLCGTETNSGGAVPVPVGTFFGTHMATVAAMHRFWRGAIDLRFTAVKNAYYSGRLIFIFYPGIRVGQITDYTSFDSSKSYQWIWDLRVDEDIKITIPFQSNLQFLRVRLNNNERQAETESLGSDTITGTLCVYVDNQLRAPESVPNNIWIHVWASGGADLTFAIPDFVAYSARPPDPNWLLSTITTPPFTGQGFNPFVGQGLEVEETFNVNHNEIGKDNPEGTALLDSKPKDSIQPEIHCIGELHNNLRPYTRRVCYEIFFDAIPLNGALTMDPAYFFNEPGVGNPLNYISFLYAFYKGSMRYKFFFNNYASLNNTQFGNPNFVMEDNSCAIATSAQLVSGDPLSYLTQTNQPLNFGYGRFTHIQNLKLNNVVEVLCPYYSNVPMQLVSRDYITNLHLRMVYRLKVMNDNFSDPAQIYLFKGGGDDFSFGYLIGAPVLFTTGAQ